MRFLSRSIAALMVLVAFVLGLALGGQVPREAAAQAGSENIGWKISGKTLVLINESQDVYLVKGELEAGSTAPPPEPRTDGILEIPTYDLDQLVLYRLEAAMVCDRMGCRPCNEMPALCPMPPRPIPGNEVETYFHPF